MIASIALGSVFSGSNKIPMCVNLPPKQKHLLLFYALKLNYIISHLSLLKQGSHTKFTFNILR
jgi:hypothetical protein